MPPEPEAPRRRAPRVRLALALGGAAVAAAGCGSLSPEDLPPAATPATSPPLAGAPAGRLVPSGEELPAASPATATAGARTFTADPEANAVRVLEGGREIGRLRTGLQPAAVAVADERRQVGVLAVRERVLELFDARTLRRTGRANAGTGPTHVASDGGNYLYVTDTTAGAVLIYRIVPELTLVRRYRLAGAPYAIAYDNVRRRLWVTLTATNRLAELTAGRRIRLLRTHAAVRRPDAVAVDEGTGAITVTGREEGVLQLLDPPLPRQR